MPHKSNQFLSLAPVLANTMKRGAMKILMPSLVQKHCSSTSSSLFQHHQQHQKASYGSVNGPFNARVMSAKEALTQFIKGGNRVFLQTGCNVPKYLLSNLESLVENKELVFGEGHKEKVEFVGLHINYYPGQQSPHLSPKNRDYFHTNAMFHGANERAAMKDNKEDQEPLVDYLPIFLSEAPLLFKSCKFPIDVALIQVSPPDAHGYCSLGVSVDISLAAVESAKFVIAQVNRNVPRTHGDGFIHISQINAFVYHDEPLSEIPCDINNLEETDRKIGEHVASLIPDRACLQLGVGSLPNAVCAALTNHKDIGIHTELMSDGILELFKKGVITNKYKGLHQHEILCTFVMGTKNIYDFVNDNPQVIFRGADYVNDISNIKQNKNMIAVNSAIEIDLSGQVCADSIGTRMYSGVGGQMDFMVGSAKSKGGKPIIAIPSVTSTGESKIVNTLKQGAGVVTTRAHVHYVCTEYGVAELYGKNVRERAKALISIAHPMHRDRLTHEAKQRFGYF
nr:unnamed protein product [Naegleria fowleri]